MTEMALASVLLVQVPDDNQRHLNPALYRLQQGEGLVEILDPSPDVGVLGLLLSPPPLALPWRSEEGATQLSRHYSQVVLMADAEGRRKNYPSGQSLPALDM